MIKAVNKRKGVIHVLAHGAFQLEPGTSFHDEERFAKLSAGTIEALQDMIKAGDLELSEADAPTAKPAEVVLTLDPPPPAVDSNALPADDAAALVAIASETEHAKLDAWFTAAVGRPAVSEALLTRITQLS